MGKKIIILTVFFFIASMWILPFLNKKQFSNTIISYEWSIWSDTNNVIVDNSFSWNYQNNKEYNIIHNIHIKQNQSDVINIILNQKKIQWLQSIMLQDYSIATGKWNHRLTIFDKEFLKTNKQKTLSWIENLSGVDYTSNYKKWLLIDVFSLQWTYNNQFNQKNYYNIVLKINCGIYQYINKKYKCTINWKILLDLPINTYTKNWHIKWILHKKHIK